MGCWNGTCFVTNQAIRAGEPIALILIKQKDWRFVESDIGGGGFCYEDTFYTPIPYTFFGKYNEYGSIEKYDDDAKNVIESMFPTLVGRDNGYNSPADIFYFIERGEVDEVKRMSFVMIKRPVYDLLVKEFGTRFPYKATISYRDDIINAVNSALELESRANAAMDKIKMCDSLSKDLQDRLIMSIMIKYHECEIIKEYKEYFDTSNFIDTKIFISAISLMRKFWFPQTGAGAQQDELYLHYVVNKKMVEIYEADRAESIKEATDEPAYYNEHVLKADYQHGAETLMWSPSKTVAEHVIDFNAFIEDSEGDVDD